MYLPVMLAVNDYYHYRNGRARGVVDEIEITDVIRLEGRPIACRVEQNAAGRNVLRVGRLRVPLVGYQPRSGNWCWDCVLLASGDVALIVNYLRRYGWEIVEAVESLAERYQERQLTEGELEEFFEPFQKRRLP